MPAPSFRDLRERCGLSVEQAARRFGVTEKTVRRWETGEIPPKPVYLEVLALQLERSHGQPAGEPAFRFIDLFAGIGGMRRGFEAAGGRCVFTSEWDEYARRTYRANFPGDEEIAGDITAIKASSIPQHDVLLAGFPCQPFSLAGVSKKNSLGRAHGFMDQAQGTLFFDVLRILKHHRPAAFLLENVKNLRSHDQGETFRVIRGALEEDLGYHISWRIIDARGYVPQHRERIFIAGFREDTGFDFDRLDFTPAAAGPRLGTILHAPDEEPEPPYTDAVSARGRNARSSVGSRYTLSDRLWQYLQDYAEKHRLKGNGFGFGLNGPTDTARTLSARYYKDGSEILIRQEHGAPRRLTPRECARLMGFDAAGRKPMIIPVSDTRAYKQFGNAVVVPVIAQIAAYMKPHVGRILDPGELFVPPARNDRHQSGELVAG